MTSTERKRAMTKKERVQKCGEVFTPQLVHGDNGITFVGGLADKHCAVGAIREEDLIIVNEKMEKRINEAVRRILDGMKEGVLYE